MKSLAFILALFVASSVSAQSKTGPRLFDQMKPIFDGKSLAGWVVETNAWIVKDGAMASTGAGRGVIHTRESYGNFRLVFQVRHVSGQPDHQAGILIFCATRPTGEKGSDALHGIQFQVPNGGHWDYRAGHNNAGTNVFTKVPHPRFDPHEWSQVEIIANAKTGLARMAVAQPVGTRAVEVLSFKDPEAGRSGPIAWQMHNQGLFDEYKDVRIEIDPKDFELISTK